MRDDHPNRGPHRQCQVDHGGRSVPDHCTRGCAWPCPSAELPPPEIPWREPTEVELASCRSAKSLLTKARKAGWDVCAHFARGPYIGADGESLGTADALALIFRWDLGVEAYAIWYRRGDEWSLGSAYQTRPHIRLGGNELGHWLCGTEPAKKKEAAA